MNRLRYLLPTALCLMLAATAHGQVEIIAPSEALESGRHYLLEVRGLATEDLPRTMLIAEPKDTTSAVGVSGWAGQQFIWFSASDEGRRFVALAINQPGEGPPVVAGVTLDIGGEPDPDPPPPPPPPGELAVVVIEERDDRTDEQHTTMLGLWKYLEKEEIRYRMVDDDRKEGVTGKTPEWMKPFLKAAEGGGLPLLLIGSASDDGVTIVAVESLPATAREAVEMVEEYR